MYFDSQSLCPFLQEADRDKDGFLNVDEYREIAKKEGIDLTLEEAQHLVAIIDKDKDGWVRENTKDVR